MSIFSSFRTMLFLSILTVLIVLAFLYLSDLVLEERQVFRSAERARENQQSLTSSGQQTSLLAVNLRDTRTGHVPGASLVIRPVTGKRDGNRDLDKTLEVHKRISGAPSSVRTRTIISAPFSRTSSPEPDCGDAPFTTKDEELKWFKPLLIGQDLCRILETTDAFAAALTKANISFFMDSGTLVGSFRHHGIVPWDDDVDFMVPRDREQEVKNVLKELKPKFILDSAQVTRWKLYEANGQQIPGVSWKYPFLDIIFYEETSTHIRDDDIRTYPTYKYPKDWIFPLTSRPLNGRWLPAPQQTQRMLQLNYKLDMCETGSYNHRLESLNSKNKKSLPCEKLHGVLPFVKRATVDGGCTETLLQGDRILGQYFFVNKTC
ncbi:hypothetical protein V1264_016165 [Littorina saxatilis]|uniref:LicD/FKTN/FKRP nucleotidyltransferase domain-containing protein n=1 Tax=Littorina saxatilis TaxID=31220 RepID=A0AAN9GHA1_9CAEN